jgi:uncharacterized cupin superfamily protein
MPKPQCLIKKDTIEAMDGQQKEHFLNSNARCVNKSLGDLAGITGFGFHITEIQPNRDSTEYHFHYNEDECVYILSGQGTAQIGDETAQVSKGDFLGYRKGGPAHTIRNTGSEVLKCIVVGQRLETDVVDYPKQEKRIFRAKGLKWQVVDFADLDDRPVPSKS